MISALSQLNFNRASRCPRPVAQSVPLPHGPIIFVNRLVRTHMPSGVGAGGQNPPATLLERLTHQAKSAITFEHAPGHKGIAD
jgi:hypothetical protein